MTLCKPFQCNNKCDHNRNQCNNWSNDIMIPSLGMNDIFSIFSNLQTHWVHLDLVIIDDICNMQLQYHLLLLIFFIFSFNKLFSSSTKFNLSTIGSVGIYDSHTSYINKIYVTLVGIIFINNKWTNSYKDNIYTTSES